MSLLQRKPEKWRRLHATPSAFASASGIDASSTSASTPTSATPVSTPHAETTSGTTVGPVSGGKERKKRKRGVAVVEDEIDALFEGSLGRKVARSALVVEHSGAALESTPLRIPSTTTRQEKLVDKNADSGLGAVVDAIRAAPKGGEGKKRRLPQPG